MKKMKTERESAGYFFKFAFILCLKYLKEGRNCILCIIWIWSLFCSVQNNMSLNFLLTLLVKPGFHLSAFWFLVFLYLWFLVFSFSVLYFEFKAISKDLIMFVLSRSIIDYVLFNIVLALLLK